MTARLIAALGVIAVLQVLILVVVWLSDGRNEPIALRAPLLSFSVDQIDRIEIRGAESAETDTITQVTLTREGNEWILPDYFATPANAEQVATLLTRLADLEAGWPVAESAEAAERFEVSPTKFQRHLRLSGASTEPLELYLGTTPGLRQVHARAGNEEAIRTVRLAVFDVPADPARWVQPQLLQFEPATISEISISDAGGSTWSFQRDDSGSWVHEGIGAFLDSLSSLRFSSLEAKETLAADTAAHRSIVLTDTAGQHLVYRFFKDEADSLLAREDLDFLLRLQAWQLGDLLDLSPEDWLKATETESDATSEAASEAP